MRVLLVSKSAKPNVYNNLRFFEVLQTIVLIDIQTRCNYAHHARFLGLTRVCFGESKHTWRLCDTILLYVLIFGMRYGCSLGI